MFIEMNMRLGLAMAALMMSGMSVNRDPFGEEIQPVPEVSEEQRENLMRNKGLTKFFINGHYIWALNKKSALKKASKLSK